MEFRDYLKLRFGISIPKWLIFEKKGDRILAYVKDVKFIKDYDTFGISAGKSTSFGYKPSTEFLQMFGDVSMKNVVFVSNDEAKEIAKGKDIEVKDYIATDGYVIVMFEGKVLGCGLLKKNKLINQIPKSKRI